MLYYLKKMVIKVGVHVFIKLKQKVIAVIQYT